jgi:hypothetical protein
MTKQTMLLVASAIFLTANVFGAKHAYACSVTGGRHTVGMTRVETALLLDAGTTCSIGRSPCKDGCKLQSVRVVSNPRHGVLKRISTFRYRYVPAKNFRGTDEYAVHWCEFKPQDPHACYTVYYSAIVR